MSSDDKNNSIDITHRPAILLKQNLTPDEIIKIFSEYIDIIDGKNSNFIIVDGYLFCRNPAPEYKNILKSILDYMKFKTLKVITAEKNFNPQFFQEIQSHFSNNIEVIFSQNFHDRFWIAEKDKAFLSGSSLNGIGKKHAAITLIDSSNVKELMNLISQDEEAHMKKKLVKQEKDSKPDK